MTQAIVLVSFPHSRKFFVKTYDIVLINIPCQYAIFHKSKFMLANSILWSQVVNKIKFMCQIIAMSWTLTIKCMLLHQIT